MHGRFNDRTSTLSFLLWTTCRSAGRLVLQPFSPGCAAPSSCILGFGMAGSPQPLLRVARTLVYRKPARAARSPPDPHLLLSPDASQIGSGTSSRRRSRQGTLSLAHRAGHIDHDHSERGTGYSDPGPASPSFQDQLFPSPAVGQAPSFREFADVGGIFARIGPEWTRRWQGTW